jgi:hypothetical protein
MQEGVERGRSGENRAIENLEGDRVKTQNKKEKH